MSELLKRDYQICEEIGRGRFGVIFKVIKNGDFFAVKSIEKRLASSDSLDSQCLLTEQWRICVEGCLGCSLDIIFDPGSATVTEPKILQLLAPHPNVIGLHGLYEDDHHLHMVLDLCDAPDLFRRVTLRPFAKPDAASVMSGLMQAVAHCHRLGVAHRDIKPDNVLFHGLDQLRLADFGSAETFGEGELMSGVVETPYYVEPEVVAGMEYGEKVDVWSAGVVLYIMLAGFPPFYGESAAEIFEAVLRANLRFPGRVFHSVSPFVKDLLRMMLCKDVSRRFSAEQVLRHPWITSGGGTRAVTD